MLVTSKASVINEARATRGAAVRKKRELAVMLKRNREDALRTVDESRRHILARLLENRRLPVKNCGSASALIDFRWRTRRRKAGQHFGAYGDQKAARFPL
jgi:hypothetical protein